MDTMTVWTKQQESVLCELAQTGRYIAKREYIVKDLEEHAPLVLEVYDWLVKYSPTAAQKPEDVQYPVWVSFGKETAMLPSKETVLLELTLPSSLITAVNIAKWGTILNYSYIPADAQDAKRHRELLAQYGVSDPKAYMSQFYPQIKREIIESWSRLFDDAIQLGNDMKYGIIWEMKQAWITQIIR